MTDYQFMPALSDDDYAALKADIAARGIMVPIEVDEDGNVLDGHHRLRIAEELGVPCPRTVRAGLSERAKRTHARQLNIARRHLGSKEKRDLIEAELRDDSERSNRQIGAELGVSKTTVDSVRQELEDGGQIDHHDERTGKDGVKQPVAKPRKRRAPNSTKECYLVIGSWEKVSDKAKDKFLDYLREREIVIMPERMPVAAKDAIAQVKELRTWTPVEMYQAFREALKLSA